MGEDRHTSEAAFGRWMQALPEPEFDDLLQFANRVQSWSWRGRRQRGHYGTFGQAAAYLGVPVERIADAVGAHYWLFSNDYDRPLSERRIDHEGE